MHGGAENLANYLVSHISQLGHQVRLLRIPFCYEPAARISGEMLACRMMEIEEADLVIGLKFPAYLVPHPNKVLWLVHQYRQAYDMWDSGHTNIPDTLQGHALRSSIFEADRECFENVNDIFAISPVTQDRLKRYNGVDSKLLRTPLNGPEDFEPGDYGDYIFCGGRINAIKRQHLLIEAMRYTRSDTKLVIAGPADSPADAERLHRLVERFNLQSRVTLEIGFLPRQRIVELTTNSLAAAYLPIDEESLGYVSMEANQAARAVLTVDDSGGILDLVSDDHTGWVRRPEPKEIADAIDRAFANKNRTIDMGRHARQEWIKKEITWERTVERLVA